MSVTDEDREKATELLEQHEGLPWDLFQEHQWDSVSAIAAALAAEREKARAPFRELADRMRTVYKGEEWDAEGIADLIDDAAVDGQPIEFQAASRASTLRGRAIPRRAAQDQP